MKTSVAFDLRIEPLRRRLLALAAGLIASAGVLVGCAGAPIPPTYTEQELKSKCLRENGCWHEDDLRGGFCEYKS